MKAIALIPARSGSKGIPDKNIFPLCGRPLLAYTVDAAIQSGVFDRVIVSTDSADYALLSRNLGAESILRGEEASGDRSPTYLVIEDLFRQIGMDYDFFALLQPTSPLRSARHIREAVSLFSERSNQFDFLVSVCPAPFPSVLVRPVEDDLSLKHFDTDFSNYRRQGYREYSPNGAIYIAKPEAFLRQRHFYGARSLAYIMNEEDSVDIDHPLDLIVAEAILKSRQAALASV